MNFIPDQELQIEAEDAAASAVEMALGAFAQVLDYSDASIKAVEFVLSAIHEQSKTRTIAPESIRGVSVSIGYYIGETFRRNHGAEWGWVESSEGKFVGMRATQRDILFWPAEKALGRITNGEEDSLVWYYHSLLKQIQAVAPVLPKTDPIALEPTDVQRSPLVKKSWIGRLFGA